MARKALKSTTFSGDKRAAFLEAVGMMEDSDAAILKMDVDEKFTPTRSIVLDNVLRLKGLPRAGRVIHIHGKEHGGKSTLCYSMVKAYQQQEEEAVVIFDFEGTATGSYLKGLGVDCSRSSLIVMKPTCVEDAIKQTVIFMKSGVKLFIFDSIPRMKSMIEEKEIMNGAAFKQTVGLHARTMQNFFDILLPWAIKYDCLFIMVNQIRARIEMTTEAMMAAKYPSITNLNYTLPGGKAAQFASSLSIEVNAMKAFRAGGHDDPFVLEPGDNKGDYAATKIKVRIIKNKATTGGYREYHLWLRPGLGLDDWISVRELARSYGLIFNKGKSWIVGTEEDPIATYGSKQEAIDALILSPDFEVLSKLKIKVAEAIEEDHGNYSTELTPEDQFILGDREKSNLETTDTTISIASFDDEDDDSFS